MEELLIKKVKEREFLFNVKSPSYKDRIVRQEAWEQIGKELDMKPEIVKEKWLKLRRCFTNALNRRRSKQNECDRKIVSWKFGKQMSFLLPHLDTRKTQPTEPVECKQEEEYNNSDQEQQEEDTDMEFKFEHNSDITESQEPQQQMNQSSEVGFPSNIMTSVNSISDMESRITDKKGLKNTDRDIARMTKENLSFRSSNFGIRANKSNYQPPNVSNNQVNFTNLDESDMFYLSMSRMSKRLPMVDQAKIKLLLSQAVLEAEITNFGRLIENEISNASILQDQDCQSSSSADA